MNGHDVSDWWCPQFLTAVGDLYDCFKVHTEVGCTLSESLTKLKNVNDFFAKASQNYVQKKTTQLPYLCFTNPDSYYEGPKGLVPFKAVVKMPKIKEIKITLADRTLLDDYRKKYLQSVKQLSIREQNTKFKAGTFPLYAYQKETQSVDTIDFEILLINEKETGEQASLIMFPTGTLLLLSVEV
ncbi:unnamed protein product [Mytilus coruscus]|uniref:Uncharacterized protein n=1 Tax=Mytilus coruscus TaxID=42192 RepID=A0A6J8BKR1_MYTCO|nr:unnamed protein product [Mytilus coruscus]